MHLSISILPIQHLYLYILLPVSLLRDTVSYFSLHTLSCTWTHSACRVRAESKQSERQQKAACPYPRGPKRQTSPTLHPPSSSHSSCSITPSTTTPPTPIPTLPTTCKPRQSTASTLQNACLSTFSPPPSEKKWLQQQCCSSASLSLSQLSLTLCTQTHSLSFFPLSFFPPPFKVEWSEHRSCIV